MALKYAVTFTLDTPHAVIQVDTGVGVSIDLLDRSAQWLSWEEAETLYEVLSQAMRWEDNNR